MDIHRNGQRETGMDRIDAQVADEEKGHIRFLSLQYYAVSDELRADRAWTGSALSAFSEWVEHMKSVVAARGALWFLTDASGTWIETRGPAKTNSGQEGLELKAMAVRAISEWNAEATPYAELALANGNRILAAALNDRDNSLAYVLGLVLPAEEGREINGLTIYHLAASYPPFLYYQLEKGAGLLLAEERQQSEREARKMEQLYQMARDLYSKNDTDEILAEIIRRIQQFLPDAEIDLLMTQDQQSSVLPVKPLRFSRKDEDTCTRAFMEGQIIMNRSPKDGKYELAVPISGQQGIYGILHLHSRMEAFEHADIQIMKVLSDAAGSAFENAKLYEQSNILVNELRLINELTKQLNQSLRLNDIFNFASKELTSIYNADFCCILQLDREKKEFVVQATNVPAMMHESFDEHYGFAGIVFASKEPVIVSDYWSNPTVLSKLMQMTGARSLIAAPLIVRDEVQGVILVAHRVPGFFTYDNYKLLQVLAGHIGLALANASLHAEVRRMVITDNLTGLYARHYLDEQVSLMQKKDFCGSLIVVDIDHFKKVNDSFGHQVGDKILIQVSRIIKASIRDSDIAARWGGEELAIYLPQVTTEQASRIATRIRTKVEAETHPSVTVSCGISEWHWQDEKISVELLFYRSDMALYQAKNEGRNRVKIG